MAWRFRAITLTFFVRFARELRKTQLKFWVNSVEFKQPSQGLCSCDRTAAACSVERVRGLNSHLRGFVLVTSTHGQVISCRPSFKQPSQGLCSWDFGGVGAQDGRIVLKQPSQGLCSWDTRRQTVAGEQAKLKQPSQWLCTWDQIRTSILRK